MPAAITAALALAAPAQASTTQVSSVQAGTVPASTVQASTVQAGTTQASTGASTGASAAQAGKVSIAVDSMSPQTARPGAVVTVAGTVTNGTSQTQAGLDVQLLTSPVRFQTRDEMDVYLNQGTGASLEQAGSTFVLPDSLRPGTTAGWRASFQVDAAGMTEFGVYPVTAQLADIDGDVLAAGGRAGAPAGHRVDLAAHRPATSPGVLRFDEQRPDRQPGTRRPAVGAARGGGEIPRREPDLGHRPGAAQRR
jgi:hypothetical protein